MLQSFPQLDDGGVFTIFGQMAKIGKPLGIHAENAYLLNMPSARGDPAAYPDEYAALSEESRSKIMSA